jgi:hypothetical protein
MTEQEKISRIKVILAHYQQQDAIFTPVPGETEQQQRWREDLQAIVNVIFEKEHDQRGELSVADLQAALKKSWQKTKPDAWK